MVVLIVLFLIVLLGMAALVIDVGYAYYTQRALQASADAAALAGAQELPDPAKAEALALQYSAAAGGKNERGDLEDVTTTVTTKCLTSVPGCDPVNAVVVMEKAPTKTFFAGLLGIDTFKITARSTACSPCGVQPLDIMMVLDRTGSMCIKPDGVTDDHPACTDLKNARDGMKTFLQFLEPTTQWVGLAVLPPSPSNECHAPASHTTSAATTAYKTNSKYTIVPLSGDYATSVGSLDPNSDLVTTINCQQTNGFTGYANALKAAQAELDLHGRDDVKDVIVFLSDGAANIGPSDVSFTGPNKAERTQPCAQGKIAAASIKEQGTLIYSIGYDLGSGSANQCRPLKPDGSSNGPLESPSITAKQALQGIATSATKTFFEQPNAAELKSIFTAVAADLQRGTAALIDESAE